MTMSKTFNFTPTTACWYSCNFSQPLLTVLWGSNSNSGLDMKGFRYTLDEQGTDIDDIFIMVSVSNLTDAGGIVGGGDQFVKLGLSSGYDYDNYILPNKDNIIDIAFGYVPNDTTKGALSIESSEISDPTTNDLYISGYDDGTFKCVIKLDDDTIIGPFECRKYLQSTYTHSVTGDPVFFSRGGQDADYAWAMGTNNGGYHIETPYLTKSQTTSFTFSHKVYETIDNAINHLKYGIEDGALGQEESDSEELTDTVLYYYDTMELYNDLGMTDLAETYHKQIIVRGSDLPLNLERTLVTYSVNPNGLVDFHVANGGNQYLTNVKINQLEYDISDNLSHNLTYYITQFDTCGFGMYYDPINGYYVKNTIKTNMRGIGANGDLIPPESIIREGDEMLSNSNSADYDVGLSECWLLSKESVQSLGKKFNTTVDRSQDNSSAYVVGDWILGLSAYPNPLDVVCDLFYLPVDVGDFVDSTQDSFTFSPIE